MAAQPANTDISIYLSPRSFRNATRQDSVASLIKRLRPLVMSVPGHEVLVEVKSRDTTVSDLSPFMGQASKAATRGFPIVIGLRTQLTFASAQASLPGVDFAFQIGQDKFLKDTKANLTRDMYGDLQALNVVSSLGGYGD